MKFFIATFLTVASLQVSAAGSIDLGRSFGVSEWIQDSVSTLKQRFFRADEKNIGKILAPNIQSVCKSAGATVSVAKADDDRYLATCDKAGQPLATVDAWRVDPATIRYSLRIPTPVVDVLAYQYANERDPLKATPSAFDSWSMLDIICSDFGATWQMREDGQWNRYGYCKNSAGEVAAHIVGLDLDPDFVVMVSTSQMPQKPEAK